MRKRHWKALTGAGVLVSATAGCVSMEQYDQLEMSHRTLKAEKAQCESELYDTRGLADGLRAKLTSTEGELDTKGQLVANLQAENDRLETAFATAQETLEKLADRAMPTDPVVITETRLPPALDAALKDFASQYPSDVSYSEAQGAIKWKADLLFALGSDVVKETAMTSLDRFSDILKSSAASGFEVLVVGHTDDRPIARASTRAAHPTNWHLSVHRAIAVAKVILGSDYDPERVGVMGYGEYRPVAPNDAEENRGRNRRVEIYLVERGSLLGLGATAKAAAAPEPVAAREPR